MAAAEPKLAESVEVEPLAGEVLFKPRGAGAFQRLEAGQLIPVGSSVNVKQGKVRMTSAARTQGATVTGDFSGGKYQVRQSASDGIPELPRVVPVRPWPVRRGRIAGTVWSMEDRCDGTLTIVREGVVVVRDFAKRRNIAVRAGRRYLARPRARRRR